MSLERHRLVKESRDIDLSKRVRDKRRDSLRSNHLHTFKIVPSPFSLSLTSLSLSCAAEPFVVVVALSVCIDSSVKKEENFYRLNYRSLLQNFVSFREFLCTHCCQPKEESAQCVCV